MRSSKSFVAFIVVSSLKESICLGRYLLPAVSPCADKKNRNCFALSCAQIFYDSSAFITGSWVAFPNMECCLFCIWLSTPAKSPRH